jgi:hypothetical protein
LGYGVPQFEDCLRQYARSIAEDIVACRLPASDGCFEITSVCELLDFPSDLYSDAWMELVNGYHPSLLEAVAPNKIESKIRHYTELMTHA